MGRAALGSGEEITLRGFESAPGNAAGQDVR